MLSMEPKGSMTSASKKLQGGFMIENFATEDDMRE